MKRQNVLFLLAPLGMIVLATVSVLYAGSNNPPIVWDRVAYYDYRYHMGYYTISTNVRNALEDRGYTILNADQLKVWMNARIADRQNSVLVPCQDVFPDNIVESGSDSCTLRRYLDAGGKVVLYHRNVILQGHPDANYTYFSSEEEFNILGVSHELYARDNTESAILTGYGLEWGLTQTWIPIHYLRSENDVTVLATFPDGRIAAWVKHYVPGDNYRGFIRIYGRDDMPLIGDIQSVAEYPNELIVPPEPTVVSNPPMPQPILSLLPKPTLPGPNDPVVFGWPTKATNVNSTEGDCEASISADGLELYFRRPTPGWNWNIWVAKRVTNRDVWNTPIDLGSPVNVVGHTEGPSVSTDGLELYFSSSRFGALGGKDQDYDIWVATRRTRDHAWERPVNLGRHVNSSSWELFPSISADGLELYFESYRPGGKGGADLWVTTRPTKNELWGEPVNLGPVVNYKSYDGHPSVSADGLSLYFVCNSTRGGFGRRDIWITRRATTQDPWGEPMNLGPTVNTFLDESGPCISADGRWLFFDRHEGPGYHYSDIWQVEIDPPVVDSYGLRLEAEEMVRDPGVLDESPTECRITEENARITSSIVVLNPSDLTFTVKARAEVVEALGRIKDLTELLLYFDDEVIGGWVIESSEYKDYTSIKLVYPGIHKVEVEMIDPAGNCDWDLIVDFIDLNSTF